LFNIPYIEPAPFHWQSAYACGLFDSDGSVILSVKQHNALTGPDQKGLLGKIARLKDAKQTQLTIKITQKYKINLEFLTTPISEPRANRKTPLVLPRLAQNGQSFYRDQRLDAYSIKNSISTRGLFGNTLINLKTGLIVGRSVVKHISCYGYTTRHNTRVTKKLIGFV
jgi:hypothetical protein